MTSLTDKIQSLADQCAKEHGFYAASYVGPKNNVLVFAPLMQSSNSSTKVESGMIGVVNDKAEYITTKDSARLLEYFYFFTQNGSFERRGERAYKAILSRLDAGKLPQEDVEYATYIKEWGPKPVQPGLIVEPLINPSEFFLYFDVADRLGKHLQFCEEDNHCHYIKILD